MLMKAQRLLLGEAWTAAGSVFGTHEKSLWKQRQ
jgi:hypothetical protein